mgnify:FL=1
MIIMSVDLGKARTGLAVCDESESFAFERGVITEYNEEKLVKKIAEKAREEKAELIVCGLPKNMDGSLGFRAQECTEIAEKIEKDSGIKTVMWDERCTTLSAAGYLNETNTRGKKRKQIIDAVAAVIILEDYLAFRKRK